MADEFVQGHKLYVGGRDLSGDWTALALRAGREPIEFTRGDDVTRWFKAGLQTVALEADGIVDLGADLADEELTAATELTDVPIILAPTTGLEGAPAWAFEAHVGDYEPFAEGVVGGKLGFRVSARASGSRLVRGTIMEDGTTARTATGNGTERELGAVSATQKLYACVMCLSASAGDTLDVTVRSAAATGMAGATTRVTFTQIAAAGAYEWKEVSGAITDTFWDVRRVIAGNGSESFNLIVLLAIA